MSSLNEEGSGANKPEMRADIGTGDSLARVIPFYVCGQMNERGKG